MKISVYIATSLDGYIARDNGDLEWLDKFDHGEDDYGYHDFIAQVDVLMMGRKTFEQVLTFGDWPYGELQVVVLSQTLKNLPKHLPDTVQLMSGSPEEVISQLETQGINHVYLDGGKTIQQFLQANLIDEMILSTLPVLIGSGIPLFGDVEKDKHFQHIDTKTFKSGLVQSKYQRR